MEFADKALCSRTTVSDCELGKRPISPRLKKIFSNVLEVPESMLIEEVTVIFKAWAFLLTDPRYEILIEEIRNYDSVQLSKFVHNVHVRMASNYSPGGNSV